MSVEPEEWLASIDEETLAQWQAHYALEPWGDEQAVLARIAELLSLLLVAQCGGEAMPASALMPSCWIHRPKEKSISDVEKSFQ